MAPRGIGAFVVISALVLSMTVLSGVGYYATLGTEIDAESQNDDVVAAAEQLDGVTFGEGRSSSILEGPLAVVVPVVGIFQTFTTIITNTSGVVQLLFGVPKVVGDSIELLSRLVMLVTIAYLIRSGSGI